MRINLTCRNELMHRLDKKKYFAQFDVFFNYGDSSVAKCEQSACDLVSDVGIGVALETSCKLTKYS